MKIVNQMQEGVEKPRPKVAVRSGELVRVRKARSPTSTARSRDVNYDKSKVRVGHHLRPRHAGRAGFRRSKRSDHFSGRRCPGLPGAASPSAGSGRGAQESPMRGRGGSNGSIQEKDMAKKIVGFIKLQIPAGKANPAPDRSRAGSARSEHHGVLQGVQRRRPRPRAGPPCCRW